MSYQTNLISFYDKVTKVANQRNEVAKQDFFYQISHYVLGDTLGVGGRDEQNTTLIEKKSVVQVRGS